jgi:hypothetical protein
MITTTSETFTTIILDSYHEIKVTHGIRETNALLSLIKDKIYLYLNSKKKLFKRLKVDEYIKYTTTHFKDELVVLQLFSIDYNDSKYIIRSIIYDYFEDEPLTKIKGS